jgi:hypothetical protein
MGLGWTKNLDALFLVQFDAAEDTFELVHFVVV